MANKKISEENITIFKNSLDFLVNDNGVNAKVKGSSIASEIRSILTGSGAPSSTPSFLGQKYIDTTGNREYYAIGISSSADWRKSAKYAYGTQTITGGGGDVTINLDFNWTDGMLKVWITETSSEYIDITEVVAFQATHDSLTNGSYTAYQNMVYISDAATADLNIWSVTKSAGSWTAIPKSATNTSFTLHDDGVTTKYIKWMVIA